MAPGTDAILAALIAKREEIEEATHLLEARSSLQGGLAVSRLVERLCLKRNGSTTAFIWNRKHVPVTAFGAEDQTKTKAKGRARESKMKAMDTMKQNKKKVEDSMPQRALL